MARSGRRGADESLAAELATGKTVREAAAAAGVSERTAFRRVGNRAFTLRVKELREGMVREAAGRLTHSMTAAADVLAKLLGSQSEGVQLRAAVALLDQTLKVVELTDLQQRLAEVERRLREEGRR